MTDLSLSVIEGFYGRQWTWQQRAGYATFLSRYKCQAYIYAPKGDAYLRSRWRESWPADVMASLQALSQTYKAANVSFGVGVSPIGLLESYTRDDARALKNKIAEINQLNPEILCILFDDMHGAIDNLATKQLAIINDVLSVSAAKSHIICPTYYSFDPVLQDLFGAMPEGYLNELGVGLPHDVGVFWTGDQVISKTLDSTSLSPLIDQLGRKPIIWDNLFANDGKKTADFLPLTASQFRDSSLLSSSEGVVINPMNQSGLSQLMLLSYLEAITGEACERSSQDEAVISLLERDSYQFSDVGLAGISDTDRRQLIADYQNLQHPAAIDVVEWLKGGYCFDPACLTG